MTRKIRYMSRKNSALLLESARQAGKILRKEIKPGRVTVVSRPASGEEVKELRQKVLHVTQQDLAKLVGEGVGTVQSWEQGNRRPNGAASKLLRLLKQRPELSKDLGAI